MSLRHMSNQAIRTWLHYTPPERFVARLRRRLLDLGAFALLLVGYVVVLAAAFGFVAFAAYLAGVRP